MITIITCPHPALDQGAIKEWKNAHPQATTITDIAEYAPTHAGLFGDAPGTIIIQESALIGDIRELVKKNKESDDDVLVMITKPLRGKTPPGTVSHNYSFPAGKQLESFISKHAQVSTKVAQSCIKRTDNPVSALALAHQCSLLTKGATMRGLIDPLPGDNPPWDIMDALFSGNVSTAVKETIHVINATHDPIVLYFQISGFLRKTITAQVDGSSDYFLKKNSFIKDVHGLVEDIAFFSDPVMSAGKKNGGRVVASFVASAASRCKK